MKRRLFVGNAFSVSMLSRLENTIVEFKKITTGEARDVIENAKRKGWETVSFVGHPSTADIMSKLLNVEIQVNRVPVTLMPGDQVLVFSINMRLPEGKILDSKELEELVEQGKIQWWLVRIPEIQPII